MKPRRLATYKEETCPEGQCLTWGHCSVDVFISTHQVPGAGLFCWELERQPAHRLLRTRSTDWEGASWVRRGLLEGRPWRTIIYMLPTKWFSANISFALQKNPEYYLPYHRSGNWGSKKVIVLSLAASRGRGEVPDSPKLHWVLEEAELASRLWLWSLGSSLGQLFLISFWQFYFLRFLWVERTSSQVSVFIQSTHSQCLCWVWLHDRQRWPCPPGAHFKTGGRGWKGVGKPRWSEQNRGK